MKQLTVGLLGLTFLCPFPLLPVKAQNAVSGVQRCNAGIDTAQAQLVNGRRLQITDVRTYSAQTIYNDFPDDQPVIISLTMRGNDADTVMNSPQLLTAITQTIINGCSKVGMVSYGVAGTDWQVDFGQIGNQIRQFECVDVEDSRRNEWGHTGCL